MRDRRTTQILQVSHAATVTMAHLPVWQLFISYDAFVPDHEGEQMLQLQWINGHQKDSLALYLLYWLGQSHLSHIPVINYFNQI